MSRGFGGKQKPMRDTVIIEENGYLGMFPRLLNINDTQHFSFQTDDVGPHYIKDEERLSKKLDVTLEEEKSRKRTKKELLQELTSRGISLPQGKNMEMIKEKCQNSGIPLEIVEQKTVEVWNMKPKGLLQVCWERGLIDESRTYKVDELREILSNCTDFQQEETQMQAIARELDVTVIFSPKCHPEFAGEGLEYFWSKDSLYGVNQFFYAYSVPAISTCFYAAAARKEFSFSYFIILLYSRFQIS